MKNEHEPEAEAETEIAAVAKIELGQPTIDGCKQMPRNEQQRTHRQSNNPTDRQTDRQTG